MFIFTVNISHFFIKIIYMDDIDGKDIAMNFIATHIRPNKSIDFSQNMTVHAFF